MEPLFENRYIGTHRMIAEFGRKYAIGPRPWTWFLFAPFVVFFLLVLALELDAEMKQMIFYFLLVLTLLQLMPQFYAWSSIQNTKKQNDGVQPQTSIIFGDTIELHEGMVHITVEYRKILRVLHLKHSYMLMIGKRNGIMLDPNGFTKGTFSEFKQFLREKRPDLKIPE